MSTEGEETGTQQAESRRLANHGSRLNEAQTEVCMCKTRVIECSGMKAE